MEKKNKLNSFKKLLDRLQEDSWQLELLISAFAIFGLFYALEPIQHEMYLAYHDKNTLFIYLLVIVHFSLQVLIFNLLMHLLLRGIWIGSLGLRYVSGEIDFDKLNYSEQFTNYLKKRVGSFDAYIDKLENLCSVIFAISFLLVFYIFSFFIITFIFITLNNIDFDEASYFIDLLFGLYIIGVSLVFFDFITQGLLKKNRWLAKLYFPFYWVFSFLTLSFLYRPLIYNFLDNKYGKRVSFLLVPFYILIYIVSNLDYQKSNFMIKGSTKLSESIIANRSNYENIIKQNSDLFIDEFAIQSKVITEPYVKLIIPVNGAIEDSLIAFNTNLKQKEDKRGLHFRPEVSLSLNEDLSNQDSLAYEYLNTFEEKYSFKIDTISYKADFVIAYDLGELVFESYIGIQAIPEGKHIITLQSLHYKESDSPVVIKKIPFWYYKN